MSWTASGAVKQMTIAPNGERLTKGEKLILFVIADYTNAKDHSAWPSIETIAKNSTYSPRRVRELLRSLERKGAISIEPRRRPDGSWESNKYRINVANPVDTARDRSDSPCPPCERSGEDAAGGSRETLRDVAAEPKGEPKEEPISGETATNDQMDSPVVNPDKFKDDELLPHVAAVFEYYLKVTEQGPGIPSLSPKRKKIGLGIMRYLLGKTKGNLERSKMLMMGAAEQMSRSDFHMGRDPKSNGQMFVSWEQHLFRSIEQFENWLTYTCRTPIRPDGVLNSLWK